MHAHAAPQSLSQAQTDDAFKSIKDLLKDPEFASDSNAQDALSRVEDIEDGDLIDFAEVENSVISNLKNLLSRSSKEFGEKVERLQAQEDANFEEIREEISNLKGLLEFCSSVKKEEDDRSTKKQFDQILQRIEELHKPLWKRFLEDVDVKIWSPIWTFFINYVFYYFLMFLVDVSGRRALIMIAICLLQVTLLEEMVLDMGCVQENIHDPLNLGQPTFHENLIRANTKFVGREWLFKNLTNFFEENQQDSRGVLLVAAPGFGKSAFIANLVCSKLSSYSIHNQILAYHMCIHSQTNTQDPSKFVQNIALLISNRIPEYHDKIKSDMQIQKVLQDDSQTDPTSGFNNGIVYPLADLNLRFIKPMYIVVDALDECYGKSELSKGTDIVGIITQGIRKFPDWLKVIGTSRNIPKIRRQLIDLKLIELHPENQANLQDIEQFINRQREKIDFESIGLTTSTLVEKSQGNFLYVKLVLDRFKNKAYTAGDVSLPESISSIYHEFFRRKYGTEISGFRATRRLFEILAATLSPLKVDDLYYVLSMEDKDLDYVYDFLPMLEDLAMYLRFSPERNDIVGVFHNSLMEWLTDDTNKGGDFYVDAKKGQRLLAKYSCSGSKTRPCPRHLYKCKPSPSGCGLRPNGNP